MFYLLLHHDLLGMLMLLFYVLLIQPIVLLVFCLLHFRLKFRQLDHHSLFFFLLLLLQRYEVVRIVLLGFVSRLCSDVGVLTLKHLWIVAPLKILRINWLNIWSLFLFSRRYQSLQQMVLFLLEFLLEFIF